MTPPGRRKFRDMLAPESEPESDATPAVEPPAAPESVPPTGQTAPEPTPARPAPTRARRTPVRSQPKSGHPTPKVEHRTSDSPTSEVSSTPEAPTLPDLLRRRRVTVQTEIPRERVSYYLSKPIIDAVERLTLELSLELGKRVTKADVVDGLLTLGLDQRAKLVREIRKSKGL